MTVADAIVKAAKRALNKSDAPLKLKALAKTVADKVDGGATAVDEIKSILRQNSNMFQIDGKMVSLKSKKRKEAPEQQQQQLPPTKKVTMNKNSTSASVAVVDTVDATAWRKENKIVVLPSHGDEEDGKLQTDPQVFPWTQFETCKSELKASLIDHCVEANGFVKPSPIQAQAWPILASGKDMVGIAETGSGKTLAFGLVALSFLANQKVGSRRKPRMLVLAPTRELAMQSDAVLCEFGKVVGLQSVTLYGGVPKHTQVAALKKGNIDCLVATPGRLKDLIQDRSCDLSSISILVLDEADRMLDMGFEEDVKFIISQTDATLRQTSMFSATWPTAIQEIAAKYMKNPIRVLVGFDSIADAVDDSVSANKRVEQIVEVIEDRQREARLREILKRVHKKNNRILIFALYKKEAERLENALRRDGWNCGSIHGNKQQGARTAALSSFKEGICPLLIATDVAARGLDIPNVEVVINFTFPLTIEDYVHRIGRTGRAGKQGISYTFFQPTDKAHAGALQNVLRQVNQDVPEELAKFGNTVKKKEHKLYGNFGPSNQPMKKATRITFDSDNDE